MRQFLLVLGFAFVACGGDDNNNNNNNPDGGGTTGTVTPSVSGVSPATAFLGREMDVQLSGFGTAWTDATTVSFGDGITVTKVTAASATGLIAHINVATTAALGARDITVGTDTFKAGFTVDSPVKLTVLGKLEQGSIVSLKIENKDFNHLFDTTTTGDGFLTPLTYTGVKIKAPTTSGSAVTIDGVTPFLINASVTIDVTADASETDLDVTSGTGADAIHFVVPKALAVTARTPTALTGNVSAAIPASLATGLYKITPGAGNRLQEITISATAMDARPAVYILPKSGKISDLITGGAAAAFLTANTDPYYVIVWDNTGTSGYMYALTYGETAVTIGTETEPNEDAATQAQSLAAPPAVIEDATLSVVGDIDWYRLTVTANQKIHARTFGGDSQTDTIIAVYASTDLVNAVVTSEDLNYHEDITTGALTAGTYYVKVFASAMYYDPAHIDYVLAITLE